MGSWNQTCAISNLPITSGEEVVILYLTRSTHPTVEYQPSTLNDDYYEKLEPISLNGKYDDYGGAEDISGIMKPVFLSALKKNLVELEQGENPCHDIEVKKVDLTYELIFRADNERRLFVDEPMHGFYKAHYRFDSNYRQVSHIQVKKSVFDSIVNNAQFEIYRQDEDGKYLDTVMCDRDYLVAEIPTIIDHLKTVYSEETDENEADPNLAMLKIMCSVFSAFEKGKAGTTYLGPRVIKEGMSRGRPIVNVEELIVSAFISNMNDTQYVSELLVNIIDVYLVNMMMCLTNRRWVIPAHAGQEFDTTPHETLQNIITKEIEEMKSRWDEE